MPTQLPIPDYTTFKPQVAWATIIQNVEMLSAYVYNVTAEVGNINDLGAGTKEVGFFIRDFVGTDYRVTAINVGGNNDIIQVEDILQTGYGPQSGQPAVVYKSVGDGTAPIIGPIRMDLLDKSARDAAEAVEKDAMWKGQKPTKLPFTGQSTPTISDYNTLYAAIYGQNPKLILELISNEDGTKYNSMQNPLFTFIEVGGVDVIDTIRWDLGEPYSGKIILARE